MDEQGLVSWIRMLISEGKVYKFYKSKEWEELREEILEESHHECQNCARFGIFKRATMVHHINEIKKRPDLALSREYVDSNDGQTKKNLIALCHDCHEMMHDRMHVYFPEVNPDKFTNEERW